VRRLWLPTDATPAVAAGERLAPAVEARLLAEGDRLAAVSSLVAQRYYRHAAAAWHAFGADGFARWVALGETLATRDPVTREGAAAFFDAPPAALGGLDTAAAWSAAAREIAGRAHRLAAVFLARTAGALATPDVVPRLRAIAAAGVALHDGDGWRGAFVAQAFLEAAGVALAGLAADEIGPWAELGRRLARAGGERDAFAALPAGFGALDAPARARLLALVSALGARTPDRADAVWRALPQALAGLTAAERAAVLAVLEPLADRVAAGVADVAPVIGAALRRVPAAERVPVLGALARLAAAHPEAAVAGLRVLPRLYEEAGPAEVRAWLDAGAALCADNAAAGRAFLALESRTSWRVLKAASTAVRLDETQGVWRKLVQMLTGEAVTLTGTDVASLRPPLGGAGAGVLPAEVGWLATHEDNWRAFRFLALQVAGRREFGTHAVALGDADALHEDLFLLADGVRVCHRLGAAYRGVAADAPALLRALLARWRAEREPSRTRLLDALLALVLVPDGARPPWLAADVVRVVRALLAPLAAPGATAADALGAARALAGVLGVTERTCDADVEAFLGLVDWERTVGEEAPFAGDASAPAGGAGRPADVPPPDAAGVLPLDAPVDDPGLGGRPLTREELRRLLESGARLGQAHGDVDGPGLPVTDLAGKLPAAELDALRRVLRGEDEAPVAGRRRDGRPDGPSWWYDEWDHRIGDYRTRWCRLTEIQLPGDSGEFFSRALGDHAALVPEVRRQFQQIRPEQYRIVRGLEDGEDFDLNAVIDARIDLRARRTPSTRLYRARVREARDVATLFLLDMSASTDEPLGDAEPGRPVRRIIDAIKAALVVMTEALDELGDAYAIYGFSGQGRDGVEFYPVKGFAEPLGAGVKARIGGVEPRRSTRMGAALRHATRKMAQVGARSKHLILLSDGFPQDHDYGDDRRSHVYGIRDTAVALREADAAGITPFCITVDRAGHDYLREMCEADRYLVIDDVAALPRELPKVYGRVVRA
jgi:nitric oxide reductase NorD protein